MDKNENSIYNIMLIKALLYSKRNMKYYDLKNKIELYLNANKDIPKEKLALLLMADKYLLQSTASLKHLVYIRIDLPL